MQAAGLMPPYYPVTKTYSLDCLIKLGIGVKGTSTVGSTIVIKKAAAAGIAGAAEVAAVANNPVAMVIGAGYAANGVFEHCECKDK
jgi:hypothetical protein